jgi:hypothetical protein
MVGMILKEGRNHCYQATTRMGNSLLMQSATPPQCPDHFRSWVQLQLWPIADASDSAFVRAELNPLLLNF